eukprot:3533407-Pleurochrysis_carterae.AAC.2
MEHVFTTLNTLSRSVVVQQRGADGARRVRHVDRTRVAEHLRAADNNVRRRVRSRARGTGEHAAAHTRHSCIRSSRDNASTRPMRNQKRLSCEESLNDEHATKKSPGSVKILLPASMCHQALLLTIGSTCTEKSLEGADSGKIDSDSSPLHLSKVR